ncbi:Peptidoglycan/LPS O-acetylase OafA/YrhL, contains acyltransferase and SGNH-hydrolase domains [Mucilaginibacter pineti]|uniref:Peptidoglycan/LPS O-acetylase OafA/YrhL, contains acyltransferase and SGNH-hydrolase domains n=1 Tax=Mucilaginibacter pineti TaxID=1391627 RepID=A0A1G6TUA3_9SPHI|nr:acyltransferase [Mucilaginibacter pineti]SDD32036.1 Peptidoglycan/LPS O-acetylase OafA/YrhL, contains acyltransferase and SGNH-hydrolase domains [Mucilaginibacter pineti]
MSSTPLREVSDKIKTKVFFPNLNGVRALAALMVVVSHVELHKVIFHVRRIPDTNLLNFGKAGVTIFFSLSGFLITYLLLEEKRNFTTINFKGFYMRRILRIWPLYYLVVLFGFFVYPGGTGHAFWLSVFFLPNLAFCLQMLPAIFDPIWSIGTEEQFYIFHPHFFRIKKLQHILYALLAFIVLLWAAQLAVDHLFVHHPMYTSLHKVMYYSRFDNMMIGAVVAVLYYNTKHPEFNFRFQKVFNAIFRKKVQLVILNIFLIYLVCYLLYDIPHGDVLIAALASLLIVNLCEAKTSIYSLNNKYLGYIGQISYSIYLLHKFVLFLVLYLISKYLAQGSLVIENIIIYTSIITLSIALASLSYYGYERPFLNIKKRFQKITQ